MGRAERTEQRLGRRGWGTGSLEVVCGKEEDGDFGCNEYERGRVLFERSLPHHGLSIVLCCQGGGCWW